jgi:toxin FitB
LIRYLLDTNIIGDAVKPAPSSKLEIWMQAQNDADLHIAAMSLAEIWRGLLLLPSGRKRAGLETWFAGPDGPPKLFDGRILPFDDKAALIWGRLMADGKAQGLVLDVTDMHIAAVAEANECLIVTANEQDFLTVPYLNPMAA